MNTFILKWNPAISDFTMEMFNDAFRFGKKKIIDESDPERFHWNIWDHEKAQPGDRCFMLVVGDGDNNGIMMSGNFVSLPYRAESWRRDGSMSYSIKMDMDIIVEPTSDRVLPTALLSQLMPSVDWTGGHCGVLIDPKDALQLEKAWYEHLKPYLSPRAKAKELARIAHFGQKDKAGKDYINHPLRVALGFYGAEEIVALLHDVVEVSDFTLDSLARDGFSKVVVNAVNAMTRRQDETYEAFIRRAGRNRIARRVKMEDLCDNLNLLRLPELTDEDLQRIRKYHKAYKYLESL